MSTPRDQLARALFDNLYPTQRDRWGDMSTGPNRSMHTMAYRLADAALASPAIDTLALEQVANLANDLLEDDDGAPFPAPVQDAFRTRLGATTEPTAAPTETP